MANLDATTKNMSNNHDTSQPSFQSDVERKGTDVLLDRDGQVLEETRQVLKRFLVKHLSQNGKGATNYVEQKGSRLEVNEKHQLYRRQHSKPEQGNFVKSSSLGRRKSAGPMTSMQAGGGWPMQNSRSSLKSETDRRFEPRLVEEEEQPKYQSEVDIRAIHRLSEIANSDDHAENNSIMFRLLRSHQEPFPSTTRQSGDSLPSASENSLNHIRRKSFSKALSRKSVISYLENQAKATPRIGEERTEGPTHSRQPSIPEHCELQQEDSSHQRQDSGLNDGGVILHPLSGAEASSKEEDRHKSKNLSFRERMKKIMSNKKKLKYKKPEGTTSAPKTDDSLPWDDKSRADEARIQSADPRIYSSIDSEFNRATENLSHSATGSMTFTAGHDVKKFNSTKHKSSSSHERTPSPSKTKTPFNSPKILRAFSHKKHSPKPKRGPFHQSSSTASLSLVNAPQHNSGELQRDKSGSLPMSMRYGVGLQLNPSNQRRLSESLFPVNLSKKQRKRSVSPDKSAPMLPERHDIHGGKEKKQKANFSKLRRFIRLFRKRHASESSTASSRGSHSLPSIPAAVEQEQNDRDRLLGSVNKGVLLPMADRDDEHVRTTADELELPYHHRGSLSFSSGDLDGLSAPEKKQIYDEIAETLTRLSSKYTKHIRSRSAAHASRLDTSDFAKRPNKLGENLPNGKISRSASPPSRLASLPLSKTPTHSPGKNLRKFEKNENSRAMNAFLNLSNQSTTTKEARPNQMDAVMPKTVSPRTRRIVHGRSGSLDSPISNHPLLPDIRIQLPSPSSDQSAEDQDVVDGIPARETERTTFLPDSLDVGGGFVERNSYSSLTVFQESNVDLPFMDMPLSNEVKRQSRESRPSTSKADDSMKEDAGDDINDNPYLTQMEEDKLVQALVDLLCKKGDQYTKTVDMPNGVALGPVFRMTVLQMVCGATYSRFQNFAQRFCTRCQQLVETSPTRHPEVFPFVMVFSMTQLIVNLASSEAIYNRITDYTSRFISNLVEGSSNNWDTVLERLQDTEAELSQEECSQDANQQKKDPSTDDELD